jgi:hypothetical protein
MKNLQKFTVKKKNNKKNNKNTDETVREQKDIPINGDVLIRIRIRIKIILMKPYKNKRTSPYMGMS